MSEVVLDDAQQSMARYLRIPPEVFTTLSGQTGPLPFVSAIGGSSPFQAGPIADETFLAARVPNALPVSLGSNLLVLLPRPVLTDGTTVTEVYTYRFFWRMRQMSSNVAGRGGHMQSIPSNLQTSVKSEIAPAFIDQSLDRTLPGDIPFDAAEVYTPLIGPGTPSWVGQGMGAATALDNGASSLRFYAPQKIPCLGDELIISVQPGAVDAIRPWDFAGVDAGFADWFGDNTRGGILVFTGKLNF